MGRGGRSTSLGALDDSLTTVVRAGTPCAAQTMCAVAGMLHRRHTGRPCGASLHLPPGGPSPDGDDRGGRGTSSSGDPPGEGRRPVIGPRRAAANGVPTVRRERRPRLAPVGARRQRSSRRRTWEAIIRSVDGPAIIWHPGTLSSRWFRFLGSAMTSRAEPCSARCGYRMAANLVEFGPLRPPFCP